MTIRIEKETHRLKTMIRVSGRLLSKHLDELKTQLEGTQSRIALDLNGVTLVDGRLDHSISKRLRKNDVEILRYWLYLKEWIIREKGRNGYAFPSNREHPRSLQRGCSLPSADDSSRGPSSQIFHKEVGNGGT
jgi:hypothetical protein